MTKQNKKKIIGIVSVLILILAGGVYFVVSGKNNTKAQPTTQKVAVNEEPKVKELKPEDVGLTLTALSGNKVVDMTIKNLSGISSIDYELNYNKEGNIPIGVIGTIVIKPTDTVISRELTLGTCSKNVCKYDTGVKEVNLVLKLTYSNGELGSVTQKLNL